jgi:hypothetical protein
MRSRFTLVTPPESAEPTYLDPRAEPPRGTRRGEASAHAVPPGEARINLVAGYFSAAGLLCGIGAGFAALTLLSNFLPLIKAPISVPLVIESAAAGAITCAANLRTAQLLRERRRSGAYLALFYFAVSLFSIGRTGSMFALVLGVLGMALTLTVWKHLE